MNQLKTIHMIHFNGAQRYSFGVFAIALTLFGFAANTGCTDKQITVPPPVFPVDTSRKDTTTYQDTTKPETPKTYRYLALGDSYTIGQSVLPEAGFPAQTVGLLAEKSIKVSAPTIIARTGWTTTALLNAIASENPAADYDIVTLLIGVNDQYQRGDTTGYRDRFTQCLNKAIEKAAGKKERVFVLSIPDYSVTPFGGNSQAIAVQIDQFNAINLAVTNSFGISYTDVTGISRAAKDNPSMLATDALHPSGTQYRLWSEKLVTSIAPRYK